jgi:CelD/BcsL family acetyltransferase involved in cellulose biosynthesis
MRPQGWIPYEESKATAWDAFVVGHPRGRFIHLTGFKRTVEDIYGLKSNYWLFVRGETTRAVFPSFFHRGLLYGRRVVSQPFSEYGGVLFALESGPEEKRDILSEFSTVIEKSREKKKLDYLEIRCFSDLEGTETDLFQKTTLYESALLPLSRGMRLSDHVEYSVRKNVRKAKTSGLGLRILQSREDLIRVFYPLHLRSLRRLGSPPHPLAYFLSLQQNLKEHLRLFTAWMGQRPVAALLGWVVGDSVQITDIASDERFFPYRANDFLHFEFIEWAIARGCRRFDFGPVRYAGQRQYKKKWGVELHEYAYYYVPFRKPKRPLSDQSRLARTASALWRFLPAGAAAKFGRCLRRELAI